MIKEIKYLVTDSTNPHYNLSLEEYLLNHVAEEELILYLWQNEKTVVIGKNQNAIAECKVRELEEDGGHLVRRLSGGGAVFHDLGNLNFTFLVRKDNYNVDRQLEVIIEAVKSFGIPAKKTGRNDITVDDKKFSGNAFYTTGDKCYHHGTILVSVDMSMLSHYLNVSRDKLISKGVESVKSRVTNLSSYSNEVTITNMIKALISALEKVYGLTPTPYSMPKVNKEELDAYQLKFSSWEWKFGKKIESDYTVDRRFSWGGIQIHFKVNQGKVLECMVYSDDLDVDFSTTLANFFTGCIFSTKELVQTIANLTKDETIGEKIQDIINLLEEESI